MGQKVLGLMSTGLRTGWPKAVQNRFLQPEEGPLVTTKIGPQICKTDPPHRHRNAALWPERGTLLPLLSPALGSPPPIRRVDRSMRPGACWRGGTSSTVARRTTAHLPIRHVRPVVQAAHILQQKIEPPHTGRHIHRLRQCRGPAIHYPKRQPVPKDLRAVPHPSQRQPPRVRDVQSCDATRVQQEPKALGTTQNRGFYELQGAQHRPPPPLPHPRHRPRVGGAGPRLAVVGAGGRCRDGSRTGTGPMNTGNRPLSPADAAPPGYYPSP